MDRYNIALGKKPEPEDRMQDTPVYIDPWKNTQIISIKEIATDPEVIKKVEAALDGDV